MSDSTPNNPPTNNGPAANPPVMNPGPVNQPYVNSGSVNQPYMNPGTVNQPVNTNPWFALQQRRTPLAVAAMLCFFFGIFFFFPGIFMSTFGGIGIAGGIFLVLSVTLVVVGIVLCVKIRKQQQEYVSQTAGTQPQQTMPVVSGLPPPGYYGDQGGYPGGGGTYQNTGAPYSGAQYPPQQSYPPQQNYPPTSTTGTTYPPQSYPPTSTGPSYPPQNYYAPGSSETPTERNDAPPPSYDSAVMGASPSAPPTEEKN